MTALFVLFARSWAERTSEGSGKLLLCEEHAHELGVVGSLKAVRYEPDWIANLKPNFA